MNSKEGVELRFIVGKIKEHWHYFAGSLFITLTIALVYLKLTDPKYEANATLLIGDMRTGSKTAEQYISTANNRGTAIQIDDKIGLITSYSMVMSAIENLDFDVSYYTINYPLVIGKGISQELYQNSPFKVIMDSTVAQITGADIYIEKVSDQEYILSVEADEAVLFNFETNQSEGRKWDIDFLKYCKFGEVVKNEFLHLKIELDPSYPFDENGTYFFRFNNLSSLASDYQAKLTVAPITVDSRMIELTTSGKIIQKEVNFLNQLIENYISYDLKKKNQIGIKTISFIDQQIGSISDSLKSAELALQSYRSSNRLGSDINYVANSAQDKLSELETERSRLTLQLSSYENINDLLISAENSSQAISLALPAVDKNNVLSNLLMELTDLVRRRSTLELSVKDGNPLLVSIEEEIKTTKNAIIQSTKRNIDDTRNSIFFLNQRIGALESNIIRLPQNQRKIQGLERDFEYSDKTYDLLLEKRTTAAIEYATNTADVEVVDPAKMVGFGPISPNKKLVFLLAIFFGLAIPAATLSGHYYFDEKFDNLEDLKTFTGIPSLGEIGFEAGSKNLITNDEPRSLLGDSFRSARTNLQFFYDNNKSCKVVSVTSSMPMEGKSFCAVNLAVVMARSGKKTLLIDADLRKPTIGATFKKSSSIGLSSYLSNAVDQHEAVTKTSIENLDLILSGSIPPNPLDLFEGPRIKDLIEHFSKQYNFIIIDTPPIGFASEFFILSSFSDANIYVVRYNQSKREDLKNIMELYKDNRVANLSLLFNGVKSKKLAGYGSAKIYGDNTNGSLKKNRRKF